MTDHRCEKFIYAGLVDEVINLILQEEYDCKQASQKSPEQSVGYFETFNFLKELFNMQASSINNDHIRAFHKYLESYQTNTRHLIKTQRKSLRSLPQKPHRITASIDSMGQLALDKHLAYIHNWAFALPQHFAEEAERNWNLPKEPKCDLELPYISVKRIFSNTNHGEYRVQTEVAKYLEKLEQHKDIMAARLV
mmetsp:Transcript_7156/g.13111  ORF Transcript_7156/g.13111 Transcript_7156/m.13111 type:complete len:194 (+) Transcript_7156:683-1264(+)